MNALNVGRIKVGAGELSMMKRKITLSVKYGNERK